MLIIIFHAGPKALRSAACSQAAEHFTFEIENQNILFIKKGVLQNFVLNKITAEICFEKKITAKIASKYFIS